MKREPASETEIETSIGNRKARKLNERFLKGPIPLRHIAKAAKLPGQSLSVYLAVHHQTALTRRVEVTIPKPLLTVLGVSRDANARAMKELAGAGLIQLKREKGKSSRVSLALDDLAIEARSVTDLPIKNDQWAVVDHGIECLAQNYQIAKSQLAELRDASTGIAMWPVQMAQKSWVDIEAFISIFDSALTVHTPSGTELIDRKASYELARKIAAKRKVPAA